MQLHVNGQVTQGFLTVLHEAIDYLLPAGYRAGAVRKVLEVPK